MTLSYCCSPNPPHTNTPTILPYLTCEMTRNISTNTRDGDVSFQSDWFFAARKLGKSKAATTQPAIARSEDRETDRPADREGKGEGDPLQVTQNMCRRLNIAQTNATLPPPFPPALALQTKAPYVQTSIYLTRIIYESEKDSSWSSHAGCAPLVTAKIHRPPALLLSPSPTPPPTTGLLRAAAVGINHLF